MLGKHQQDTRAKSQMPENMVSYFVKMIRSGDVKKEKQALQGLLDHKDNNILMNESLFNALMECGVGSEDDSTREMSFTLISRLYQSSLCHRWNEDVRCAVLMEIGGADSAPANGCGSLYQSLELLFCLPQQEFICFMSSKEVMSSIKSCYQANDAYIRAVGIQQISPLLCRYWSIIDGSTPCDVDEYILEGMNEVQDSESQSKRVKDDIRDWLLDIWKGIATGMTAQCSVNINVTSSTAVPIDPFLLETVLFPACATAMECLLEYYIGNRQNNRKKGDSFPWLLPSNSDNAIAISTFATSAPSPVQLNPSFAVFIQQCYSVLLVDPFLLLDHCSAIYELHAQHTTHCSVLRVVNLLLQTFLIDAVQSDGPVTANKSKLNISRNVSDTANHLSANLIYVLPKATTLSMLDVPVVSNVDPTSESREQLYHQAYRKSTSDGDAPADVVECVQVIPLVERWCRGGILAGFTSQTFTCSSSLPLLIEDFLSITHYSCLVHLRYEICPSIVRTVIDYLVDCVSIENTSVEENCDIVIDLPSELIRLSLFCSVFCGHNLQQKLYGICITVLCHHSPTHRSIRTPGKSDNTSDGFQEKEWMRLLSEIVRLSLEMPNVPRNSEEQPLDLVVPLLMDILGTGSEAGSLMSYLQVNLAVCEPLACESDSPDTSGSNSLHNRSSSDSIRRLSADRLSAITEVSPSITNQDTGYNSIPTGGLYADGNVVDVGSSGLSCYQRQYFRSRFVSALCTILQLTLESAISDYGGQVRHSPEGFAVSGDNDSDGVAAICKNILTAYDGDSVAPNHGGDVDGCDSDAAFVKLSWLLHTVSVVIKQFHRCLVWSDQLECGLCAPVAFLRLVSSSCCGMNHLSNLDHQFSTDKNGNDHQSPTKESCGVNQKYGSLLTVQIHSVFHEIGLMMKDICPLVFPTIGLKLETFVLFARIAPLFCFTSHATGNNDTPNTTVDGIHGEDDAILTFNHLDDMGRYIVHWLEAVSTETHSLHSPVNDEGDSNPPVTFVSLVTREEHKISTIRLRILTVLEVCMLLSNCVGKLCLDMLSRLSLAWLGVDYTHLHAVTTVVTKRMFALPSMIEHIRVLSNRICARYPKINEIDGPTSLTNDHARTPFGKKSERTVDSIGLDNIGGVDVGIDEAAVRHITVSQPVDDLFSVINQTSRTSRRKKQQYVSRLAQRHEKHFNSTPSVAATNTTGVAKGGTTVDDSRFKSTLECIAELKMRDVELYSSSKDIASVFGVWLERGNGCGKHSRDDSGFHGRHSRNNSLAGMDVHGVGGGASESDVHLSIPVTPAVDVIQLCQDVLTPNLPLVTAPTISIPMGTKDITETNSKIGAKQVCSHLGNWVTISGSSDLMVVQGRVFTYKVMDSLVEVSVHVKVFNSSGFKIPSFAVQCGCRHQAASVCRYVDDGVQMGVGRSYEEEGPYESRTTFIDYLPVGAMITREFSFQIPALPLLAPVALVQVHYPDISWSITGNSVPYIRQSGDVKTSGDDDDEQKTSQPPVSISNILNTCTLRCEPLVVAINEFFSILAPTQSLAKQSCPLEFPISSEVLFQQHWSRFQMECAGVSDSSDIGYDRIWVRWNPDQVVESLADVLVRGGPYCWILQSDWGDVGGIMLSSYSRSLTTPADVSSDAVKSALGPHTIGSIDAEWSCEVRGNSAAVMSIRQSIVPLLNTLTGQSHWQLASVDVTKLPAGTSTSSKDLHLQAVAECRTKLHELCGGALTLKELCK